MEQTTAKRPRRRLKRVLITAGVVLLLLLGGTALLFRNELKIISTIRKIDAASPFYYMEVDSDYHFEEFLTSGGASSDQEVSAFLTGKISQGFYKVPVENKGQACSNISAQTADGSHIWGRNYDWTGSVPILVRCTPKDGYASLSTCDFQNITGSSSTLPEGIGNQMLAIAALYVPLDGINSAGLCVADLEVNEGGMPEVDTGKTDLTITTATRLLLNKAATVEEAVALLKQYDIHASGGISHHLAVADASGASVSVEFTQDGIVVVDTNLVTNFNLAVGDSAAGGESAQRRFETLSTAYEKNKGIFTTGEIESALSQVAQTEGEWTTQWSIVYDQSTASADYYFHGDFSKAYPYSVDY